MCLIIYYFSYGIFLLCGKNLENELEESNKFGHNFMGMLDYQKFHIII